MQRLSLTDSTTEDWNYDSNENAFSIFYNKEYGLKWYKFKNSISDGGMKLIFMIDAVHTRGG